MSRLRRSLRLYPPVPEERPVETAATVSPTTPALEYTADPALSRPRKVAAEGINPFEQWSEVVKLLQEKDPMLHSYLRKSKAYFDGTRVLIDGGKTFRDFIRVNKDSQRLIKSSSRRCQASRCRSAPTSPAPPQSTPPTPNSRSMRWKSWVWT